ncbi:hypothetical protein TNCT_537231 [Trichonephila clavata]|uniref:Uncharacterized protein n=1 Tax=Trichonephila clavata TaxID=2740835 RepID=A0A8X6FYS9_TRICU|nr:hypothetical protein TNCT_537231 [Trichonephila clavata]
MTSERGNRDGRPRDHVSLRRENPKGINMAEISCEEIWLIQLLSTNFDTNLCESERKLFPFDGVSHVRSMVMDSSQPLFGLEGERKRILL